MSGRLVVKRYAKALILAAEETESLDSVGKDIKRLSNILGEAAIRDFCLRKNTSRKKDLEFVKTAFIPYVGEYTGRTIMLMAENGRIAALPFIRTAFDEIIEDRKGNVRVLVETANKPDKDLVFLIKTRMTKYLGKNVTLETTVRSGLLGGFRITWANRIIDMSVKGRIRKMKAFLK